MQVVLIMVLFSKVNRTSWPELACFHFIPRASGGPAQGRRAPGARGIPRVLPQGPLGALALAFVFVAMFRLYSVH